MTGVTAERIAETYPRLFHMAHIRSWPSISEHGLLSTNALLNLFEVSDSERERLGRQHRAQCETLSHHPLADAVIRDQKPMSDAGLTNCLSDGLTPTDWYSILNQHVFFWPTQSRLHRMTCARAYKNDKHLIIVVDTASLLTRHFADVLLSPMNSGCTVPFPHPRGLNTFKPPDRYSFEARLKSYREGFAELLVRDAVHDVINHTIEVYVGKQRDRYQTVWRNADNGNS